MTLSLDHSSDPNCPLTRRAWLARTAALAALPSVGAARWTPALWRPALAGPAVLAVDPRDPASVARSADRALPFDPGPVEALAQRAVDAARAAGATYADVRLTRDLIHCYNYAEALSPCWDLQMLGVGVRALVNGYWGFASSTVWDPEEVVRLAMEAVADARTNAQGPLRAVELGHLPAATGRWATPVTIDPFAVSIEEKVDAMQYWNAYAVQVGCYVDNLRSGFTFGRQERVVATSEGTLVTQTLVESGGVVTVCLRGDLTQTPVQVRDIAAAGAGWERILGAKIPEQLDAMPDGLRANLKLAAQARPAIIGAYTLVCDGATMAAMAQHTLGLATQLDRALGYEANAGGTSYLDDPLNMVGTQKVASPVVTLTADRSMPQGLATVKWDDEGVEPDTTTLVKDGVLHDFQTTRESAGWLKEYYAKAGKPVRSHGHAVAGYGAEFPLQQLPNLALAPAAASVGLDALIGSVADGLLVEGGTVRTDFQAKSGLLSGDMRFIRNGRLGPKAVGGAVLFSSPTFWQKVSAIGGTGTRMATGVSRAIAGASVLMDPSFLGIDWLVKGEPAQASGQTTVAPAAVVLEQAIIDPMRRA